MAVVKQKRRIEGERGIGAPGMLAIVGGVVAAWCIMMFVLDIIRDRHSAKTRINRERFLSYHRKPPPPQHREIKGYQVKY